MRHRRILSANLLSVTCTGAVLMSLKITKSFLKFKLKKEIRMTKQYFSLIEEIKYLKNRLTCTRLTWPASPSDHPIPVGFSSSVCERQSLLRPPNQGRAPGSSPWNECTTVEQSNENTDCKRLAPKRHEKDRWHHEQSAYDTGPCLQGRDQWLPSLYSCLYDVHLGSDDGLLKVSARHQWPALL